MFYSDLRTFAFPCALLELLIARNEANVWSFTDVGREATVQSLCERWWNRSDISSELKKEIPAGTDSRGGIREEGRNEERCDPFGVTLFSDPQLLHTHIHNTHTLTLTLKFSVGVPGDALMQKRMSA